MFLDLGSRKLMYMGSLRKIPASLFGVKLLKRVEQLIVCYSFSSIHGGNCYKPISSLAEDGTCFLTPEIEPQRYVPFRKHFNSIWSRFSEIRDWHFPSKELSWQKLSVSRKTNVVFVWGPKHDISWHMAHHVPDPIDLWCWWIRSRINSNI